MPSKTDTPAPEVQAAAAPSPEPTRGPAPEPLLLRARDAAALCRVSLATWWRWDALARMPAPVRFGKTVRWRRPELESWISRGCPDRRTWEAMTAQASGRPR